VADETTLGRAKVPIEGDLKQLDRDLTTARSKVSGAIDGIVANVQKIGKAALVGVGVVSGAATAAAAALGKLAIDASPIEGVRDAFEGLAESSGSSMDEMLAALQRGSAGMVAQRDLMSTYNEAAQLVSTQFANQLPDAMQYLSKIAASTGEDMDFMLDSLVKGVGRLSPMILDNLKIQVTMADATERAAQMFGVQADALSKSQIQAGMMNVVLEKLATNTASMPDVTDSAASGLARWQATIQDTKDRLGLALQPALKDVMSGVSALADKVLPKLIDFFEEHVVPIVDKVAHFFYALFTNLGNGVPFIDAVKSALQSIGLDDVAQKVQDVVDKVQEFRDKLSDLWQKVSDFLKPVADFIAKHVELQDVLIVLAGVIMVTVVPAIWSMMAPLLPVVAAIVAAIAIVVLLRKAWESNFLGIRDKVRAVLEWLKDSIPKALDWIKAKFTELKTRLSTTMSQLKYIVTHAWEYLTKRVKERVDEIKNRIMDVWGRLKGWLYTTIWNIVTCIRDAWDRAKQWVVDKVVGLVTKVRDLWRDMVQAGKNIVEGLRDGIKNAWDSFWRWVRGKLEGFRDQVLGFFGIHSPSDLFADVGENLMKGLGQGIGRAIRVPVEAMWTAGDELSAKAGLGGRQGMGMPGEGRATIVIYGGLTLNGVQDGEGLLEELQGLMV